MATKKQGQLPGTEDQAEEAQERGRRGRRRRRREGRARGVNFFVPGIPAPKGSARAFFVKKLGRAVITAANAKTRPWEQAIRAEAENARDGAPAATCPVRVRATFFFPRPQGHFGARGLKPSAPKRITKKPDLDKLVRTLLDGLNGVAFVDDAQVVSVTTEKRFTDDGFDEPSGVPGARVTVELIDDADVVQAAAQQ